MFKSGFVLATDQQFEAAIHNKTLVFVKMDGEILEEGGRIESYSDDAVHINGAKFMRFSCMIMVL